MHVHSRSGMVIHIWSCYKQQKQIEFKYFSWSSRSGSFSCSTGPVHRTHSITLQCWQAGSRNSQHNTLTAELVSKLSELYNKDFYDDIKYTDADKHWKINRIKCWNVRNISADLGDYFVEVFWTEITKSPLVVWVDKMAASVFRHHAGFFCSAAAARYRQPLL